MGFEDGHIHQIVSFQKETGKVIIFDLAGGLLDLYPDQVLIAFYISNIVNTRVKSSLFDAAAFIFSGIQMIMILWSDS